jgi:predicted regulator of Ras-like GTPase activity (Roadblock/LC7/MglB family)
VKPAQHRLLRFADAVRVPRWIRTGRRRLVGIEREILATIRPLREHLSHVTGVLVASIDGLLIVHDTRDTEPETMAAMSAAQLGLAQQMTRAYGDFQETVTRADSGYVATFAAGDCALLTVLASAELNVGRLQHEARPVAARVGVLVAQSTTDHGNGTDKRR